MKIITLGLLLMAAVLPANAQGEYRIANDDIYPEANIRCVEKYDEVEEVCDETINKLVVHKTKKNVYHIQGEVEEHHYAIGRIPIGYCRYTLPTSIHYQNSRRVVIPKSRVRASRYAPVQSYHKPNYVCVDGVEKSNWFFYFQINSDYLENKEELGHLIDYAKTNVCSVFYIDAYADANTGDYSTNMKISEMRANAIIGVLIREGISGNRLFVQCHGGISQPYRTNSLNRCVTVSTSLK